MPKRGAGNAPSLVSQQRWQPSLAFIAVAAALALFPQLCASTPDAAGSAANTPALKDCPAWLRDYATFHAEHKGLTTARYLVYHCPLFAGGGLGDRLRAMMFMLRAAHASQRVLVYIWNTTMPLEEIWHHNLIDWRLNGSHVSAADVQQNWMNYQTFLQPLGHEGQSFENFTATLKSERQHFVACGRWPTNHGCGDVPCPNATATCLFHTLFKPHATVLAHAERQAAALFKAPRPKYVAVHWRQGGLQQDDVDLTDRVQGQPSKLELLLALKWCAQDLGATAGVDPATPVLLLTDHHLWRILVAAGQIQGFVSPAELAQHIDKDQTSRDGVMQAMVEMGLLAGSACFVHSVSGYSTQALLWRGHSGCTSSAGGCWRRYAQQLLRNATVQ